jgi:5-methylcytosine-specific restriction protein B
MIYLKKIIPQDLERTPTFNVESIRDFFKINLGNGEHVLKKIILLPDNEEFDVKFQKRETRDEYRVFLKDLFQKINPTEGDILMLKKRNNDVFLCEHIKSKHISYDHLNHLFEQRDNHQLIINDTDNENNKSANHSINLLDEFVSWFIKLDGEKHHYFSDSFSENKEKLKAELIIYEEIYESDFKTKVFTTFQSEINNLIEEIKVNIENKKGDFYDYSAKKSHHMPRAILGKNNYLKFLNELLNMTAINQIEFNIESFQKITKEVGLIFSHQLIQRFVASLCTKPFVICSGLSGSGKTKLAQAFVQWISESDKQYKIIPVGADWTNREPLLGYPNGLDPKSYVTPDNGALQLILEATKEENRNKPYFIILDEMNLSHVERYFADFLSIMESKEKLKLYSGEKRYSKYTNENEFDVEHFIPFEIEWPNNLFIIGTVNIDETTYMFSPKVLDRANVIEFRITPKEMNNFFKDRKVLNMNKLFLDKDKSKGGVGQNMGANFFELAKEKIINKIPEIVGDGNVFNDFFNELQIVGSEFGYRSATEIELLITKLGINGFVDEEGQSLNNNTKIDIAIMQKLLPKLHGSRKKLVAPLETLAGFCLVRIDGSQFEDQNTTKTIYQQFISEKRDSAKWKIKYSISFEKIERMLKNVIENGFTSYAEA